MLYIFLNNKKTPLIQSLFHENFFIAGSKERAEIFNSFFSSQCSLLNKLPINPRYVTDKKLRTINFKADNIEKIIVSLNSNKTHTHNSISIRMFKICGHTICKHLELISKQALATRVFPSEWKKDNIAPCYKKGDKQNLKNYRPISLLPICVKMFERLILNEMFSFFLAVNLLVPNQSGVKPGDSSINQYLSITYDVYSSFVHIFVILLIFIQIMDLKLEVFSWIYLKTSTKSGFLRKRRQTVTLNS